MSPSFRSKSKDKRAAGKEPLKSSAKPTTNANIGGGVPARDDPSGNSVGVGVESNCVPNNGSWSSEYEDPKEKTSQGSFWQEAIHAADSDKQEKICQKNEKKHQCQKERRAQELHERCCGYLMSRKLEALTQQLVAMGFLSERATVALILNEARVEESMAWLSKGGEYAANQREHNFDSGDNLKVDISQELAQIVEMELKFKCSKQEVERAIVMCEGDLKQAVENLMKVQKQESPAIPPKPEVTGDPPTIGGSGKPSVVISKTSSASKVQSKRTSSAGPMLIQQKADNKNFKYTNMAVTTGRPSVESRSKNIQLKKIQPNSERAKQQEVVATPFVENRWSVGGLHPSVSYSLASPLQAAPPTSKIETQYASVGNELKNLHLGSVREPVIVVQRPQSKHIPTTSISSSLSLTSHITDWNSNVVVEPVMIMNPNGFFHTLASTRSFNTPCFGSSINNQLYDQFHYQHRQQQPLPHQHYVSSSQPVAMNHLNNNGIWNRTTDTSTLEATSSLGLFFGSGSNGASRLSNVDWNTYGTSQFNYTNIDWSLNRLPPPSPGSTSGPNGLWMSLGSSSSVDLYASGRSGKTVMRPTPTILSNGNGGISIRGIGLHPDGVGVVATSETSSGGSREWTSPFEEKDLFNVP